MARNKKITVRGKQRVDIDPLVFLQALLAIGDNWEDGEARSDSADVFDAAIEDSQTPVRPPGGELSRGEQSV